MFGILDDFITKQLPRNVTWLRSLFYGMEHKGDRASISTQGLASTGVAGLVRLIGDLRNRLSEEEWKEIFLCLKDAATSTVPENQQSSKRMSENKP